MTLQPAAQRTMYFIGVTTGSSSIMRVFPKWAEALGLNAVLKGIDLPIHAPAEVYRQVVSFIREDPLSLGALVTTHKIDLYQACSDLFDGLDSYALQLGEISSISKRDGKLWGHAKDPISSGLALEAFVPEGFWQQHGGEVLLMGAGGASLAMALYFATRPAGSDIPRKITITNRSQPRLEAARSILSGLNSSIEFAFYHNPTPEGNDVSVHKLPPHSLIVNATGLGKDAPGSPVTDACRFPAESLVWEINYRGELLFMQQALTQKADANLFVEDGWIYFIHGWTQVIAEVFHTPIEGALLEHLSALAKQP